MLLLIQQQVNLYLLFVYKMEQEAELLHGMQYSNLQRTQLRQLLQLQVKGICLPLDITEVNG